MKLNAFLIIDDDNDYLNDLKNLLNYINYYDVDLAQNTREGFQLLKKKEYDCMFVAYTLPGLKLEDFVVRVRKNKSSPPVFLTHTEFSPIEIIRSGISGAEGLLIKPYDLENIVDKIEQVELGTKEKAYLSEKKRFNTAIKLIKDNDYNTAIDTLSQLTDKIIIPERSYNNGIIQAIRGNPDEALSYFKQTIYAYQLLYKVYRALSDSFKRTSRPEEAKSHFKKASSFKINMNTMYKESLLEETIATNSKTINIFNSFGVFLRRRGRLNDALDQYHIALKLHPDEPHILYNIGRVYVELKEYDKAKKYFLKALKKDSNFSETKETLEALKKGEIESYFKKFATHS